MRAIVAEVKIDSRKQRQMVSYQDMVEKIEHLEKQTNEEVHILNKWIFMRLKNFTNVIKWGFLCA
jgi:hypothetical protein